MFLLSLLFFPTDISTHRDSYLLQVNVSSCFIEYKIELLMYKSTPPEFVLELKKCRL